jgi:hypothetical protein
MHVKNFWMERNSILRAWFRDSRNLHDIHHRVLNDRGLMDKNFGIGFFLFDRLFGTLSREQSPFNHRGYVVARERFKFVEHPKRGKSGGNLPSRVPGQQSSIEEGEINQHMATTSVLGHNYNAARKRQPLSRAGC